MIVELNKANKAQLNWAVAKLLKKKPDLNFEGDVITDTGLFNYDDPSVVVQMMHKVQIVQQASNGSWRVGVSKGVVIEGSVSTRHSSTTDSSLAKCLALCIIDSELGSIFKVFE